jgi:uroporphyrinogen III methyltransferase/synthase
MKDWRIRKGCVYLVGAGPGDPGLITVRGLQVVSQADVVVYDYLVAPELLAQAPPEAERIDAGKRHGAHWLPQQQINELLVSRARSGAGVVRLKGGDPFVFGRGGEEALWLAAAGIPFEVVPGVTAAVAVAAYAGIPVTHRTVASSVCLVTGHESPDKPSSDLDYEAIAKSGGTLAFYMGFSNMEQIFIRLMRCGLKADTPAAAIEWGTTPRQRVVVGTVSTLPSLAHEAELRPPVMLIVGEVVRLRDQLEWSCPHQVQC